MALHNFASMTGVLQPLDTHVFARFKLFLRTRLHQLMLSDTNRDLTADEVLDALMHAMKGVLQRNKWADVFENSGFGLRFDIRPHLLQLLDWSLPPSTPADLPALSQFQSCFPAGRYIPFHGLLSGLLPREQRPPKRKRTTAMLAVDDGDEVLPWSKRLRPRFRGRAIRLLAKPKSASSDAPPASAEPARAPPTSAMMSASGQVLHTLRPMPVLPRRSSSGLEGPP